MDDVTRDLKRLAEIELPPKTDPIGRNVVKFTILCLAVLLLTCVMGLVYALRSSLSREDQLAASLQCVRDSAYEWEYAVGDAVKLIVNLDVPKTEALVAIARSDEVALNTALDGIDLIISGDGTVENLGSERTKEQVERALRARRTALLEC